MVVDALEIAVGLIVNLLAKVLVSLWPHLREVGWKTVTEIGRAHV